MAENGFGHGPVAGHMARIPNYGKTQVNPMGNVEPPACIQNAMMTKDKKPFTYTPGGLDLSQIRTPSMARRLARQRSLEEQEKALAQQQANNAGYHPQGGAPPPPPPPQAPPPPPPLVISVPESKSPKPVPLGERPEIVIPENPIGMLRKTNSPYHWEAEKAEQQKLGNVPKFVEKAPSPLTVNMPPSSFSQQPPQSYAPQNVQRPNFSYNNQSQTPESPIHRPEAQYGSPQIREMLQRQDSQFNKSPQPFAGQSPISNGSTYSPSPNNNWRQPERRDSPANSPQSPQRGPFSPNVQQQSPSYQNQSPPANNFHTLPRAVQQRTQDYPSAPQNNYNNTIYNNTNNARPQSPAVDNSAPWRTNTINRNREPENVQNIYHNSQNVNQQPKYTPPWNSGHQNENSYVPPWNQNSPPQKQQPYVPPWASQDANNNRVPEQYSQRRPEENRPAQQPQEPRYQSSINIPVTPRKPQPQPQPEYNNSPQQKEVVYVNQEPVYFCPDSPKTIPPWVRTQKEKTKTPPPDWCSRPLDGRKSAPRELTTPPKDSEPEWVKKSNEMTRNIREVISPPRYQDSVQPTWSTRPSDNRRSQPKDTPPSIYGPTSNGSRVIPIQMDLPNPSGRPNQPNLRIVIDTNNPGYSQPTQRIMRVLSPQLVRMDESQQPPDLPSLNRSFQASQDSQPKTRIIPIQIEGGNGGTNKGSRVHYHRFAQEGPPRQSKAFKVLQIITGTQDDADIHTMEQGHGFSDL